MSGSDLQLTLVRLPDEPNAGATFSADRVYRYHLWRSWEPCRRLCMCLCNPSVAGVETNDPTVRKCMGFGARLLFGRLDIVNPFAFCATDPKVMRAAVDPVGPLNDSHILRTAMAADMVIAGWGRNGTFRGRDQEVLRLLRPHVDVYALRTLSDGVPEHPLYLPYELKPVLIQARAA